MLHHLIGMFVHPHRQIKWGEHELDVETYLYETHCETICKWYC